MVVLNLSAFLIMTEQYLRLHDQNYSYEANYCENKVYPVKNFLKYDYQYLMSNGLDEKAEDGGNIEYSCTCADRNVFNTRKHESLCYSHDA